MKKESGTFLLLVVLGIVVAVLNPGFPAPANLQNMARLIAADSPTPFDACEAGMNVGVGKGA